MSEADFIMRLARVAGIEPRYRDVWGLEREVSRDAIAALLHSMGLAAGSAAEAEDRLRAIDAAQAASLLDPVVVAIGAAPPAVSLLLAEGAPGTRVEWRLSGEDGGQWEGAAVASDLAAVRGRTRSGRRLPRRRLVLPSLPIGYYTLTARSGAREGECLVVVAPERCYLPQALQGEGRAWALTTQLYALRSARNWGIGDFGDLAVLAEGAARHRSRAVGVNPLHALFAAEPRHVSPYSPSSRLFLNHLYIDVEAVPEFADCPDARAFAASPAGQRMLSEARAAALIDYPAVAALKRTVLERLYACFRERHLGADPDAALTARGGAFREFQRHGGRQLRSFATFEALHEAFIADGVGFSWQSWPLAMRDPRSPEIAAFAAGQRERIEHFEYVQWEADRQLGEAARRGREAGLSIGLYRDLAVGVDPHGAEAWADQELLVPGATIGAPPDLLNLKGQDWGLAPLSPLALRRRAYAPFIANLRANMRHAGALRIDHVMALQHLYWVPRGMSPAAGAYVEYPFADLAGILALESQRHRCVVIGEDLGTVPEGFRERMQRAKILTYRVLIFERQPDGSFTPPAAYPELASASVATHDLPTFKGYWTGRDLEWRRGLDLYPTAEHEVADRENRERERRLLLEALVREGVLPPDAVGTLLPAEGPPSFRRELAEAVHRYLGQSSARFVLVQIEDAVGEVEQVNLPGTLDEHPNWRRKLSLPVEDILKDPYFEQLTRAINEARERPAARPEPSLAGMPLP